MSKEDDALATMVALEYEALDVLVEATSYAAAIAKAKAGDVELATKLLGSAVASVVLAARTKTRKIAAAQFSRDTGVTVSPSGVNDEQRGEKAAAFYVKAWLAAFATPHKASGGSSGGGGSTDEWAASIDTAMVGAAGALGRVASFEVAHAWNDEHKRNIASAPNESFTHQWFTKLDVHVCKQCAKYHGTFADSNDEFPEGWPPLHGDCRCIVYTRLVDTDNATPKEAGMNKQRASTTAPAGAEMAHCALNLEVKKLDLEARTVEVVMSTTAIDRHGERVELDWDLRSYKANPVVLWAHDSRDLPLGRAENVHVEGQALIGTIRFCSAAANPKAEQCLQLFREGVLNAVSVGFIPHSYRFEKEDDEEILVLAKNELVELSVTPTPANPEALVRRRQKALETIRRSAESTANNLMALADTARKNDNRLSDALAAAERTTLTLFPDGSVDIRTKNPPEPFAPFQPLIESAKSATESSMDLKEATEKLEKSDKALIDSKASEKALTDRAEKAEKALADATAKAAEQATKIAAYEAQAKSLADERDAEKKRADDLEAKTFEHEVDALVGKKITAAEKPVFLKLLKMDRATFDDMLAQRSPMKLEESVTDAGKANGAPKPKGDTVDLVKDIFG